MALSSKAQKIFDQISKPDTKSGDIKKLAKEIKQDHDLAMELWSTGNHNSRMLSTLIIDKKLLTQNLIDKLDKDLEKVSEDEQNRVSEWLLANQLMKDKNTITLLESWEKSKSTIQRRLFWYYQGRLRWTGQPSPANTEYLVEQIEKGLAKEKPQVQWMMNFTAAWIGIFQKEYRDRLVKLGEKIGLYSEEKAVKGCTPSYLPEFIRIETGKRNL